MIDHARRVKLAFYLRQLSVGQFSNDEFEGAVMEEITDGWLPEQYHRSKCVPSEDPILLPMLELCWGLYDDTRNHKLTKSDALSGDALKVVARCILFLHSKLKYEWSYFDTNNPLLKFSLSDIIYSILTLGHHYRDKREAQLVSYYEWQKLGDYDVWPFFRTADFKMQLNQQPFLSGIREDRI
ncbi:MAG: hypothetical protein EOP48_19005 [Sphingobacteriales bacterium]|nr:MAG: hypothetical protein EOP48_19005 [Sphingobacteriales bacterium]